MARAHPRHVPSIPEQIAEIVDLELAAARTRILTRIGELFGVAVIAPVRRPPAARAEPAPAPHAETKPGRRFRASPEQVAELQDRVIGLFPRKGSELKPRDVQKALGNIDRHRVSHALRALAEDGRLKLVGERGGARYVRTR